MRALIIGVNDTPVRVVSFDPQKTDEDALTDKLLDEQHSTQVKEFERRHGRPPKEFEVFSIEVGYVWARGFDLEEAK